MIQRNIFLTVFMWKNDFQLFWFIRRSIVFGVTKYTYRENNLYEYSF